MEIQLSMLGVIVRDMPAALRFYRLLGLDMPASEDEKPFVMHRMGTGVDGNVVLLTSDDPTADVE